MEAAWGCWAGKNGRCPLQGSHSPSAAQSSSLPGQGSSPHVVNFNKSLSDSHFYGFCFSRPHLLREFQLFWSCNFGPPGELGLGREGTANWGGKSSHAALFPGKSQEPRTQGECLQPRRGMGGPGSLAGWLSLV